MNEGAVIAVEQRSPEWILARVGSLGASRVAEVIAKTKSGYSTSRANLLGELVAERLTGKPAAGYTNAAMAWGSEQEAAARRAYAFEEEVEVEEVGLVLHPSIAGTHASPDGLVLDRNGELGLVEIKCPFQTAIHLDTLRTGAVKSEYYVQMQWQLACTGRDWCDYVSFDPRLPPEIQLYVRRIPRDNDHIEILEAEVRAFLDDLDNVVAELKRKFNLKEPTP
jgi:putative phage-type endonuclease